MKTATVLFGLLACLLATAAAQPPELEWSVVYPESEASSTSFYDVVPMNDGGCVAFGRFAWVVDDYDAYAVRFDADGNVVWGRKYGDYNLDDAFYSVVDHGDGTATAAGYRDNGNDLDMYAVRISLSTGNEYISGVAYDNGGDEIAYDVFLYGGNLWFGGLTDAFGPDEGWVVKTSTSLFQIDNYRYTGATEIREIDQVAGNFILAGHNDSINRDAWIARINAFGFLLWSVEFGGPEDDTVEDIEISANGTEIVMAGTRRDDGIYEQAWLAGIDVNGAGANWQQQYGAATGVEYGFAVKHDPNGGGYLFLTNGWSDFGEFWDVWFIRTDLAGNMTWNTIYGWEQYQRAYEFAIIDNDEFFLVGDDATGVIRSEEGLLMKLGDFVGFTVEIEPTTSFSIPPNGGSFSYFASGTNDTGHGQTVDVWVVIEHLESGTPVEVRLWENLFYANGQTRSGTLNQTVPANAPPGQYRMSVFIGDHPWNGQYYDSFTFLKQNPPNADGVDVDDFSVFDQPEKWPLDGNFNEKNVRAGADVDPALPHAFSLNPSYPNPFNPATTISVSLPESAQLSITVMNTLGRQVAELANDQFNAGTHSFTFDGSSLASGIYFVHASVPGELNAIQKIVLMK